MSCNGSEQGPLDKFLCMFSEEDQVIKWNSLSLERKKLGWSLFSKEFETINVNGLEFRYHFKKL